MGNIFDIFRRKREVRSVSVPRSFDGIPVYFATSPNFAEKVAAVHACQKLIAETIAKIPLEFKRYNSVGRYYVRDVKNHLFDVLAVQPNSRMTSYDLMAAVVMQMLNYGNAYLMPMRNAMGEVEELLLLNGVNYDKYSNTYYVADNINKISGAYTADQIIHLRNLSNDPYVGESAVRRASRVIGISAAADTELAALFSTGSRYRGIISGGETQALGFGANAVKGLQEIRDQLTEELRNGETIVYLPGDKKFTPFSMTPADVQLLDNKKFTVDEIARFFGVPASLIGGEGGGSYSNAEGESVRFMNQTLSPLLRQIEIALFAKLVAPEQRGYYRIQFDREALYTTDLTTKANYMKSTIEAGVRTVNEWRKADGFPSLEGGDEAVVSANLVTLKSRINEGNQGNPQS